ncbi:hypothetical protein K3495_g6520 [Podosphaera aphanis]|nr:hypothetical protein K3495_g6520 [Podosphaera aphanis]
MEESPKAQATSLEPSSGRPNPFEDVTNPPSRKRQRVSRKTSRSRWTDDDESSDTIQDSTLLIKENASSDPEQTSSTPSQNISENSIDPKFSRVTTTLRPNFPFDTIPSSPSSLSLMTPSKIPRRVDESVESENETSHPAPAMETPSSSPFLASSPHVELLPIEDTELLDPDPPVALIEETQDDDDLAYHDIISKFPYHAESETLLFTLNKILRFFQFEEIVTEEAFCKLRDWIDNYLLIIPNSDLFYDNYINHRDFWVSFPEIIWALSHRQKYFGDFLRRSREGRQALTGMFCQFGRLCGRFLAMDIRTLEFHTNDNTAIEPDLGSWPYLNALGHLFRKEESPHIGKNLEDHYQWNFDEDILQICDGFQTEGGTISALTKLVEYHLNLMPITLKNVELLSFPSRIVESMIRASEIVLEDKKMMHEQVLVATERTIMMSYEYFITTSMGLEVIIEKYITSLSPDAAATHLQCLAYILKLVLTLDNNITRRILKENAHKLVMIRPQDYPTVISVEWKFGILKKLIISAQMQLRVIGVTTMCTELLQLHHSNKGLDVASAPVLVYFAEYILEHKLIDYLVGIGSHPEIIHESGNILGFLIVTKRYKSQQTDKIWQTVTSSQDPRVVDAILRMLNHCHNLYDADNLLYLCQRAMDIPLEAFTPSMRELCNALFKQLITKAGMTAAVPASPYQLCVKLIRESSKVTVDNVIGYSEIQIWAATRFRELLGAGPKPDDRKNIYQECMKDISMKTSTVSGSICVVYTLLSQDSCQDILSLTAEHGLTRLLVEVLESIGADEPIPASQLLRSTPAGQASRSLLLRIIKLAPGTITPELGERLWNALVGNPSRPLAERNIWWQTLNAAVKQSNRKNIFLKTCFQEYLPKLSPHCFTPGALEFSREAVLNWLNEAHHEFLDENGSFESPALEQIWHMVITAPSNTIDGAAISILAEIYSQSDLILSVSREKALSIHLELVNRCLRQLKGAASKLQTLSSDVSNRTIDEPNLIFENEFQHQERVFARSLAVLREFLRAYHTKPQFSSPKLKPLIPANTSDDVEGEQVAFFYQSFDGNKHSEIKSLTLGHLNTIASLFFSLKKLTSFENFKVYCGGRELELKENEKLKPLQDLNLKGLLLVKRCGDSEASTHGSQRISKKTLEQEIIKHFDDLWSYLSMHEQVAQEIYYFLKTLPVYDKLLNNFSKITPLAEIFPVGQPFKSLYAVYGLREYVNTQTPQGRVSDKTTLSRAISLTTAAISDSAILDGCSNSELKDALALQLVEFLIQILKEPVLPRTASSILDEKLLERLLYLMKSSRVSQTTKSHLLTARSFESIIESSTHSAQFWNLLLSHFKRTNLLRELLLDDPRVIIRKSTAKVISETCTQYSNGLAEVSSTNFVTEFWSLIATLIPDAVHKPKQCEQVLSVSFTIFKRLTETSANAVRLEDLVRQWGALLISHPRNENVDQPESIDMAVHGLVNLLHYATTVVKSARQSISCGEIGTKLFRKHLFPSLSETTEELIIPKIPLLNSKTRSIMAETVFFLIKDDELQFWEVLLSMESLVSYAPNQVGTPYSYDLGYLFERSTSIRSPTGYVGLRNLSNTCYLNSLFTQLFMNVQFRSFMLSAVIADGGASQKLLSETQSLFSYMQNSYKKYVDPADLASSIRTYEETQIDVTVQMDVDEFYNLLFDRWESQIFAPDAKQTFRSFYGGQLVQQVKSKECPHVSERLEPFSAIQCDIKGKSCLEESLQAYVDGEVMEGDNKYKCSTCDKHVDAVKRACLKEIPDNLIFHLKRFDFNLRTLQRSKINDHFSFPKKIDLRPYKVEYLLDNPEEISEDVFELVGILVHSGTAESGHYYSYIRERSENSQRDSWVEFNDECVSPWDSTCMEGSCFGGPDYRGNVDSLYDKTWSAYMLFYQRCGSVTPQSSCFDQSTPTHVPVPRQLSNQIASENEILMRKYCLYDPSHTSLTLKMLQNMKQINGGCCNTTSHRLERLALRVSLNHLDQVVARTKDLPDFSTFMMQLAQLLRTCAECSRDYLDWICDCTEALRHLLIKNPSQLVRNEIASSILLALTKVKNDAPYAYGLMDSDDSDDELENNQPEVLDKTVTALKKLCDIFHINFRAWPEYFGLLTSIARIGVPEAATLLTGGYLLETLDIITADPNLPLSPQCTKMLNSISKRSVSRPIAYDAVISLLWHMIRICDASQEPVDEREDRIELALNEQPIPFTVYERNLLVQYWTRSNSNIVVEKLLQINQNERATEAIIVELLSWDHEVDVQIRNAISGGIKRGLTSFSSRPFLLASMIYCEHSKDPNGLQIMVTHITKTAARLENSDGKFFLQFFRDILAIRSCFSDLSREKIQEFLLSQIPIWAPCLLTYYDQNVRQHTEEFIQGILLGFRAESDGDVDLEDAEYIPLDKDSGKSNLLRQVCQSLATSCLDYLMENYIRPRQTVVRATLHNIQAVIEACEDTFEPNSPITLRYNDQRISTITALKRYIVEEADQEVSDWDNSDAEYDGSSEPMDSIVEINGGADEDRLSHGSHR